MENKIGRTLKTIGWIILSLSGCILFINIMAVAQDSHTGANTGMDSAIIAGSLSGILFALFMLGFGESLKLLQRVNNYSNVQIQIMKIQIDLLKELSVKYGIDEKAIKNTTWKMEDVEKSINELG